LIEQRSIVDLFNGVPFSLLPGPLVS
jgi:hypothetical protein